MKIGDNARGKIDAGAFFDAVNMLLYTPQLAAYTLEVGVEYDTIIQTAIVIKGEPATDFSEFAWRQLIECYGHHEFNDQHAGGVEDTAQ